MHVFKGDTATAVWQQAVDRLADHNVMKQESRAGSTDELLHVAFEIHEPKQRWVSRTHPLCPAFAVAELVWILTGRNDLKFLTFWLPRLPEFVGLGPTAYGAYGYRLRHQFGIDQLERAFETLHHNPTSRQVLLQFWDPRADTPQLLGIPRSDDIPCNISSLLKLRGDRLEWTQIMRSNDIFRGTPYNFIQFTVLQEVLAGWLGVRNGTYCHWSDSLHAYASDLVKLRQGAGQPLPESQLSLSLPKQESDQAWLVLERAINEIISTNYSKIRLRNLKDVSCPSGHSDLLALLLAEAAARKSWHNVQLDFLAGIQDPALRAVGKQWANRKATRSLNSN